MASPGSDFAALKKVDIQELLRQRGLKVSGSKQDLIDRLVEDMNRVAAGGATGVPTTATKRRTSSASQAPVSTVPKTPVSTPPKAAAVSEAATPKSSTQQKAAMDPTPEADKAAKEMDGEDGDNGWGEPCSAADLLRKDPPGYRPPPVRRAGSGSLGRFTPVLAALFVVAVAVAFAWAVNGRLFVSVGPSPSKRASCNQVVDGSALRPLLPSGDEWAEWLEHLEHVAAQPNRASKALTILLAGETEAVCSESVAALQGSFPYCGEQNCMLGIKGSDFSDAKADAAGRLQARLVTFLQECPAGVVVMDGLQRLDPRAFPVLFSALSEHGQLVDNGKPVLSSGAVFMFTIAMELGPEAMAPEELEIYVKEEMTHMLMSSGNESQPCDASSTAASPDEPAECQQRRTLLRALRRRFDLVAAIKSDEQRPETS